MTIINRLISFAGGVAQPSFSLGESFQSDIGDLFASSFSIREIKGEVSQAFADLGLKGLSPNSLDQTIARAMRFMRVPEPTGEYGAADNIQAGFPLFLGLAVLVHVAVGGTAYFIPPESPLEKPPTMDPKVEKSFISEAQSQLKKDPENLQNVPPKDTFLLDVDNSDLPQEIADKVNQFWKTRFEFYRTIVKEAGPDPMNQIKALRDQLYLDLYWHYGCYYSNFGVALLKPQFQCFSTTKLLLAAISATGIQLPKHLQLGVQLYYKHMQAVIYNEESKTVYDIASGEESRSNEITGDIYHASIFYHAFLKDRKGFNWGFDYSPRNDEDFLIRRANSVEDRAFVKVRQGGRHYSFPETDVMYPGLAPEDAINPPPKDMNWENFSNYQSGVYIYNEKIWGKYVSEDSKKNIKMFDFAFERAKTFLQTAEEWEEYQSLSSENEKFQFYSKLVKNGIGRQVNPALSDRALKLLSAPKQKIKEMSKQELVEIFDYISKINETARAGTSEMARRFMFSARGEKDLHRQVKDFKDLDDGLQAWKTSVHRNPQAFLAFLNSFSDEEGSQKRLAILQFLNADSPFDPLDPLGPLQKILADPSIVKMTSEKEKETAWEPPQKSSINMDSSATLTLPKTEEPAPSKKESDPKVETPSEKEKEVPLPTPQEVLISIDSSAATFTFPKTEEAIPSKKESDPKVDSPRASVLISPETMMDLILLFRAETARRWNPVLSQKFRKKINHLSDEEVDQFFHVCVNYIHTGPFSLAKLPYHMVDILKSIGQGKLMEDIGRAYYLNSDIRNAEYLK